MFALLYFSPILSCELSIQIAFMALALLYDFSSASDSN